MKRNKGLWRSISVLMIWAMLGSMIPAGVIHAAEQQQDFSKMDVMPIPAVTRIITPTGELHGDDWERITAGGGWDVDTNKATMTLEFPYPLYLNGFKTFLNSGSNTTDFRLEGLVDGEWRDIDEMQSAWEDPSGYAYYMRAMTPGWYKSIRINFFNKDPNKAVNVTTIYLMSELSRVSNANVLPGQNTQGALQWDEVPGAEKYVVKYGPEFGEYTDQVELKPSDRQPGNYFIIPGLEKDRVYHAIVVPVVNGREGNRSVDMSIIIPSSRFFPGGTGFGINEWDNSWLYNKMGDGNMNSTWGSMAYGYVKDLNYYIQMPSTTYMTSLQVLPAVPADTTLTYTAYGWKDGVATEIGHKSYDLAARIGPYVLDPIPITPDWYDRISIHVNSTNTAVETYEILWDSDMATVGGLWTERGDHQVTLHWNPVPNADYYTVTYESVIYPVSGTMQVSAEAYKGYPVTGLVNGQEYTFRVNASVNGQLVNPTGKVIGSATAPNISRAVPAGTIASGSAEPIPAYDPYSVIDSYMTTGYSLWSGGTFGLSFPSPVSLKGVQISSFSMAPSMHNYTIYGLQGKRWIKIGQGTITPMYRFKSDPYDLLQDPIAVKPGKYEGILVVGEVDQDGNWGSIDLNDIKLIYGNNQAPSSVTGDTYGQQGTVIGDTYIQ
ncbi:fibronectin type III domain-containing protein [Paenibacillus shenyangensis]|uniref:fibronectin type III domain-containing protein n=1 Tax=Paenibacillus sp. A9 TaxID=1284352 RepID=UPI00037FD277|nr:fibronectin type III domain-containing protein [Paenibacillus sp. A9]